MPHGGVHAAEPEPFTLVDQVQNLIVGGGLGKRRKEKRVRATDIPLGDMTQDQLEAEIAQRDEFGVESVRPSQFLDRLIASDIRDTATDVAGQAIALESKAADQAYQTVLRSEFTGAPIYVRSVAAVNNWHIAESLFDEGSATSTTQMARVLERMIDPDGVVRPSDLETILERAGLEDRVGNVVNAIMSGEQIPAGLAEDIFRAITLVAQDGEQVFNSTHLPRFEELAGAAEVDPRQVVHNPFGTVDFEGTLERVPGTKGGTPVPKPKKVDATNVMDEGAGSAILRQFGLQQIPDAEGS